METNGELWLRAIRNFRFRSLRPHLLPTPQQRALFVVGCAFLCVTLGVTLYTAITRGPGDLAALYERLFLSMDRWQYSRYRYFIWSTWLGLIALLVSLFYAQIARPVIALRNWVVRS